MTIDQLLMFAVEQDAADLHLQTGAAAQAADRRPGPRDRRPGADRRAGPRVRPRDRAAERSSTTSTRRWPAGSTSRTRSATTRGSAATSTATSATPGLVLRVILPQIRTIEELHLPPVIREIAQARRGLTLMSGATGSGKSTTLAAIVDLLNSNYYLKILTIEDPVEYEHASKKSLVAHVEVGRDTPSFEHGPAPGDAAGARRDPRRRAARRRDRADGPPRRRHRPPGPRDDPRLERLADRRAAPGDGPRPTSWRSPGEQLAASLVGVVSQRLAMSKAGERWPVVEVLRGDSVDRQVHPGRPDRRHRRLHRHRPARDADVRQAPARPLPPGRPRRHAGAGASPPTPRPSRSACGSPGPTPAKAG